jgi:hypothetical protein
MKLLPALLLVVTLFCLPQMVSAEEAKKDGSLRISPAYIEITLTKPDEQQKLAITLTNNSSHPITLEMFPLDFNQSDVNGTIGFPTSPGSYSYSLASFLSLEADSVTIEPNKAKVFTVLVRNRPDLSPGGHYAAIIGRITSGGSREFSANVAPSISSLIFLRKTGGERYNLSLNQADQKDTISLFYPKTIRLQFQNEGNIHLVPYGVLEIKDSFGRVLKRGILNTSSFMVMPESRRNIVVSLDTIEQSYPVSFNTLTVKGNDSLKKTTYLYRNTFLYIHPMLVGGIIAIVIGIIVLKRPKKGRVIN